MKRSATILFLSFLFLVFSGGLFSISQKEEVRIGREASQQIVARDGIWQNPVQQQRVELLGRKLASFSTRKGLTWAFILLSSDKINAMATPGGFVHVTRGLLQNFTADDELAFVLGHEIAHVEKRHSIKQMEQGIMLDLAGSLLSGRGKKDLSVTLATAFLQSRYSVKDELEADEISLDFLVMARIDPFAGPRALQHLFALQKSRPDLLDSLFGTHPMPKDRVNRATAKATKLKKPS